MAGGEVGALGAVGDDAKGAVDDLAGAREAVIEVDLVVFNSEVDVDLLMADEGDNAEEGIDLVEDAADERAMELDSGVFAEDEITGRLLDAALCVAPAGEVEFAARKAAVAGLAPTPKPSKILSLELPPHIPPSPPHL